MKLNGRNGIGNLLKMMLEIGMGVGILLLIFLHSIIEGLGIEWNGIIFCVYPCGVSFLCLVYQFIGLFDSLKESNPFCIENTIRMKKGMIFSMITSVFSIIALLLAIFVYHSTLSLKVVLTFIALLFFGVSIAFSILKKLFEEAIHYKEENELTI